MIRVKILRSCAIAGSQVKAGDSAEVEDTVARELIDMGKAVRLDTNMALGLKKSDGPQIKTRKRK